MPNNEKKEEVIIAYKAFDKDLKCRDFQYEVGKTYEHEGAVKACVSGFHACEFPLDIWNYYPLTESRFCRVELSGAISRDSGDSKIAAGRITLSAEIGISQIVDGAIGWVKAFVKNAPDAEAASGHSSTQAASGHSSTRAASGDSSKQAASGHYSTQAASGHYSTQAASGHYSTQAASGHSSTQAASGDSSKQAASGHSSKQAASGDYSMQELTGENGVAVAAGKAGKAKAAEGGCFALRWEDESRPRIAVAYVGENGIKADTWYEVDASGNFVEVK